jgi:type II secretory pathway component PulF
MPSFQFSATDANGQPRQGQIQASNAAEALQALMRQGMTSPRILAESPGTSAATRRAQAPQPVIQQNPVQQAPVQRPAQPVQRPLQQTQMPPVGPVKINVPAAPAAPKVHYTRRSSDKDIYFLFAQISEQLRAGIGPMQLFSELSQMYKDPKYKDSLAMIAEAASEGKSISDVMELWPDLYPEHVTGLIRSGEVGGFLPDAAATVSEQAFNAHKFKIFHAWFVWVLAINMLSIPLVFMFRQALLYYKDQQEIHPQGGDPFAVFKVMGHFMIWPWGPIIIVLIIGSLALRKYLSGRTMKKFRHNLIMRTPVLGKRARDESATIFSWVLSRLTRSGIPPNRSWELAMSSVPNLVMKERLSEAGRVMNEGSKLSDVVFKSNLFPQEYAPMIATGELTGDVPGALERLSMVSRAEYDTGTVRSKAVTGSAGCTTLLLTTGFVTIVIFWVLYHEIEGSFIDQANGDSPTVSQPSGGNVSTGKPSTDDIANPDK